MQEEECTRLNNVKRKLQRELDESCEQYEAAQHELASARQRARYGSRHRMRPIHREHDLEETESVGSSEEV